MAKKISPREDCPFCERQPCECDGLADRNRTLREQARRTQVVDEEAPDVV